MKRGKQTCRILKEIRRQIAEVNDIEFITSECQYQGDCLGTCPKCEAEVRYLEQQLERKRIAGKAITVLGISAGLVAMTPQASCSGPKKADNITTCDSIAETGTTDTIYTEDSTFGMAPLDSSEVLMGEVVSITEGDIAEGDITEDAIEGDVSDDTIYIAFDKMPEFPGGNSALMEFIAQNIKYPQTIAQGEAAVSGRVIVTFIIKKDGSISDPKVVRSVHPLLDKEALRIVGIMPKWKPGTHKGEPVDIKYTIPIRFNAQY